MTTLDITVLLPCRDEARTVARCVTQARSWIERRGLTGEILVVDNGSTDASAGLARDAGARVLAEDRPGYGRALRTGIHAARGRVTVMADADGTYDLTNLSPFYDPLDGQPGVVVGNRFADGPPDSMPRLNRAGNHALSTLTRTLTRLPVLDVHCGLRSFDTAAMRDIPEWTHGMDYATHMLLHAHHTGRNMLNTPITLGDAAPGRDSHLRPVRDGLQHLWVISRHLLV